MKMLDLMLAQPMVETLGWALIHFLWQGTLVALLLANVLTLWPRRAANLRNSRLVLERLAKFGVRGLRHRGLTCAAIRSWRGEDSRYRLVRLKW